VSVDTYLKGKDLSPYARLAGDDVEVLVDPAIVQLSSRMNVRTKGAAFWRGFDVALEHEHGPACRH
jgi:hypothetical protein